MNFDEVHSEVLQKDRHSTGGVSWVDFDNDGDDDLFLSNGYDVSKWHLPPKGQPDRLYENVSGSLLVRSDSPLNHDTLISSSCSWADYDNDGWIDGYLSTQKHQPNVLFKNEGGTFSESSNPKNSAIHDLSSSYSSTWVDVDMDGWVDLFVSTGGLSGTGVSRLFKNVGGKVFEEINHTALSKDTLGACGGAWGDFDNDGDSDLFIPNTAGKSVLYQNNGRWSFERIANDIIEGNAPYYFPSSVGAYWVDYDDDGDLDLSVINRSGMANFLYRNETRGSFTKVMAGDFGLDGGESGAQTWGDFDNDGDQDVIVGNWGSAPAFYSNNGKGELFRIHAGSITKMLAFTGGLATADFDNDGDLDVFLANWPNRPGPEEENHLFKNNSSARNWLKVKLHGTTSNKSAIGAKVYLKAKVNSETKSMMRVITALTCFRSQNSLVQHFGLGNAKTIDELIIEWPSGKKEKHQNLKSNQLIYFIE